MAKAKTGNWENLKKNSKAGRVYRLGAFHALAFLNFHGLNMNDEPLAFLSSCYPQDINVDEYARLQRVINTIHATFQLVIMILPTPS